MGLLDFLDPSNWGGTGAVQAGQATNYLSGPQTSGQRTYAPPSNSNQTAKWNTGQDAAIGALDKKRAEYAAYQGNASLYDPKQAAALDQQRNTLNAQRWSGADLTTGPARQQLAKYLQDGTLTQEDLGKIDITAINDDAALGAAIQGLLAAKTAPPPGVPGAPGAPATQAPATQATSNIFGETTKLLGKQDAGLKAYDQGAQASQTRLGSVATGASRRLGAADAGYLASLAGSQNEANQAAGRDILQKQQYADLDSFVNDTVNKTIGAEMDSTMANSEQGLRVQGQAMDGLLAELSKSVSQTDEAGQNNLAQLQQSIKNFQTAQAGSQEQTNERNHIIKLAFGLVMAGAGAAAVATGAGAPVGAGLIASGLGTVANS